MIYLPFLITVFLICAPLWIIAVLLAQLLKKFEVAFKVKEKIAIQEKQAVAPEVLPELDIDEINARLDTALALRTIDEPVDSHIKGLGDEREVEADEHSSAVNKLRNLGK
jgi:hypothetical protein